MENILNTKEEALLLFLTGFYVMYVLTKYLLYHYNYTIWYLNNLETIHLKKVEIKKWNTLNILLFKECAVSDIVSEKDMKLFENQNLILTTLQKWNK